VKRHKALQSCTLTGLLMAALAIVDAGCASSPKPNWNERIGHYTLDDAVRDLGPSASSSRLQDGSVVAEWFLKYGSQMSFGLGTGAYGPSGGVGVGQTVTTPPKAHFLRLTFGPDGKLLSWEKVKR
jgi:hypothetical protein